LFAQSTKSQQKLKLKAEQKYLSLSVAEMTDCMLAEAATIPEFVDGGDFAK